MARGDGLRGDARGQGTIEWIGALLVVAALITVVLGIIPSTEPIIKRGTICLVQRVFQLPSSCTSTSNLPSNEVVCPLSTDTDDSTDQVSVLFVNVGNDHTLIKTTYSNGEVQYTLVNESKAELQATLVKAEAEVGGVGFDVSVTAAAGGFLQGSKTWTFPNQAAANSFASKVNSEGGWGNAIHDVAGIVAGPIGSGISDLFGAHGAPSTSGLDPKNLTFSYTSVGVEGNLQGGANFGLGAANGTLSATLQGALGVRKVTSADATAAGGSNNTTAGSTGAVQKGDYQYFISLNGSANASIAAQLFGTSGDEGSGEDGGDDGDGSPTSAGAAASGEANGIAVVTVSPSGKLVQMQVLANAQYTAGAGVSYAGEKGKSGEGEPGEGEPGEGEPGEGDITKSLGLTASDGAGYGYQYSGTLNLENNPAAKNALLQMLTGNSGPATSTIMQQMNSNGTQRIEPYEVSKSQGSAGLQLEAVDIGGGVQASTSKQDQSFSPGTIKVPGGTWQKVVCEK